MKYFFTHNYLAKKFIRNGSRLVPVLILLIVLVSCDKVAPPEIQIPEQSQKIFYSGLSLGYSYATETIEFTATANWSVEISEAESASWLSVSPMSGEAGNVKITVVAERNKDDVERSATISLTCGNDNKSILIIQSFARFLQMYQLFDEITTELRRHLSKK